MNMIPSNIDVNGPSKDSKDDLQVSTTTRSMANGQEETENEEILETTPFFGNEKRHAKLNGYTSAWMYALTFFAALGGFLFGYDTGVISGALLPLERLFGLDDLWKELVVSATVGAAILGAISGGWFNDRFGRRLMLIISSLVFGVGAVVMAAAANKELLLLGRTIVGIAIGYASTTVPMYVGEAAPAGIRGRMITIYQLFITFGQFVASVVDGLFSKNEEDGWRYMLGLGGVPAIVMMFGMLFMPESPRYLVSKGRVLEAERVLCKLRGTTNIKDELNGIIFSCQKNEANETANVFSSFVRTLKTSHTRRAIIIGCGLQAIQQLCGINTVMYYSATIISQAGVKDERTAIWLAAVVAAGNFIFSFVALFLVERAGRLKLTLLSLFGVIASLCLLATTFVLVKGESPRTVITYPGDSCNQFQNCYDCVNRKACGFCYEESRDIFSNGSCISYGSNNVVPSVCNSTGMQWTTSSCPTSYGWLAVLAMVLYLAAFAPGMGPMPWAINAEIYPLWARSIGNACSTSTNWLFNLLVSFTFLHLITLLSSPGAFIFYAGLAAIGWVFIFLLLPETKGKSLEEIEDLFKEHIIVRCRKKETSH